MSGGVEVVSHPRGPMVSVQGEVGQAERDALLSGQFVGLAVGGYPLLSGGALFDLEYLEHCGEGLRVAHIQRYECDVAGLRFCPYLEDVLINTGERSSPDFRLFAHLKELRLDWRPRAKSLYESRSITSLRLSKWPSKDLRPLAGMKQLETLHLTGGGLRSLDGVEDLPMLRSLEVFASRKFSDLSPLSGAPWLRRLWLESCKRVDDIEPVRGLAKLRVLGVMGCGDIDSLSPIRQLTLLERLALSDTRVKDSVVKFVEFLPSMKAIIMQHYNEYDGIPNRGGRGA